MTSSTLHNIINFLRHSKVLFKLFKQSNLGDKQLHSLQY